MSKSQSILPFSDVEHIVALSGGKDSTALALLLAEKEPRKYTFICTPTGNELSPMNAHWAALSERLGAPIIQPEGPSLEDLIQINASLPNVWMRWCTRKIKIEPFERYIRMHVPCVVYVGIRADESGDREGVDYESIPGVSRRFPLDEWGMDEAAVLTALQERGQDIPRRTDCAWCFFQTLWEWYCLWRDFREEWMRGELFEFATGHTFRSPQRDTWPTSMRGLRQRFEAGEIPKQKKKKRSQMCSVCAR